jgi:copper chaperone CopZ
MDMTETRTYTVSDLHCGHCRRAVETEIGRVAGVERIEVDLNSKLVTVHGADLSDQALRDAIDEAGYEAA